MAFDIVKILGRSITLERENSFPCQSEEECSVTLNGREYLKTKDNVITISGLTPSTEYTVAADGEEKTFVTAKEEILLDVRSFGAVGDGVHNDTAAVQAAIMACPDGGTVMLKKGVYLTGPVFLKSHMTFLIAEDAELSGLTDRSMYPYLPGMVRDLYDNKKEYNIGSYEGNPLDCYASLITAINCEDLNITGGGTINGNADKSEWWVDVKNRYGAWRPQLVFISHCKNVCMQNVKLMNSPSWTLHPYYSDDLSFLNLRIWNPSDSPNTDGFDPQSCEGVLMLGCSISVGDDCIAIKSGKLYMAMYHHKETKNIRIRNCRLERGHGSVTVGSEIAGGVRDILVNKCIFSGTDRGVRIKTRRGRGERAVVTDMVFKELRMEGVHMPVTVNMFYFCDPDGHTPYVQSQEMAERDFRTPSIGSIVVEDTECTGVDAAFITAYGLPESPVESIELKNIKVTYLPETERVPMTPIMMDDFPKLCGRSLYLKNVDRLSTSNVTVCGSADEAPFLENVKEAGLEGLKYLK